MVIWFLFAVLTAAVVLVVLRPLLGRGASVSAAHRAPTADLAVYQAQLAELDADIERGVLAPQDAKAARIEVSRKILQLADREQSTAAESESADGFQHGTETPVAQRRAIILAGLIPILTGIIYVNFGAPHLPDLPHAPRLKEDLNTATAGNLLARVEARLRTHPEDGKGWDVIAPFYFRAGRYHDAADAYRKAIQLLGETPERMIGYVKAAIIANNGIVSEDLRHVSERLRALVPERAEPKFWLALALEQDGKINAARQAYQDLLATARDEDPWRDMVQGRLDGLAKTNE